MFFAMARFRQHFRVEQHFHGGAHGEIDAPISAGGTIGTVSAWSILQDVSGSAGIDQILSTNRLAGSITSSGGGIGTIEHIASTIQSTPTWKLLRSVQLVVSWLTAILTSQSRATLAISWN